LTVFSLHAIFHRMKYAAAFATAVAMFAGVLAAQAQNADPAARDWREIVSPQDRAKIENWETLFDQHLAKAEALPDGKFYNFDRATLRALRSAAAATSIQPRWAGQWPCRSIVVDPKNIVIAYGWFACRVSHNGSEWRIEKYTGSVLFDLRLMHGGPTGVVAFGELWTSVGSRRPYDPSGSNVAGVAAVDGRGVLSLFTPYTSEGWITEIDLTKRIR
jgi:hypothetical protein